jgi:hypothetical protein
LERQKALDVRVSVFLFRLLPAEPEDYGLLEAIARLVGAP